MRVVEVAEFYSPTGGGVRSYIDRKFDAAAAAGHELFVIAPSPDDGFEPLREIHRGRLTLEGRVGRHDDLDERRSLPGSLVGSLEGLLDLAAKDEGHGFRKKTNRDFYQKAIVTFLEKQRAPK